MMKKILILFMSVLCGCGQQAESSRINELASKGKTFRLSQAVGNNWDRVFIFSPYSSISLVCEKTLPRWTQCNDKFPHDTFNRGHLTEGDYYLVFVKDSVVTNAFTHNRSAHSFQTTKNPLIITKESDEALVNKDGVIVFQSSGGDSNVYTK